MKTKINILSIDKIFIFVFIPNKKAKLLGIKKNMLRNFTQCKKKLI
jgi:hypothetical protein